MGTKLAVLALEQRVNTIAGVSDSAEQSLDLRMDDVEADVSGIKDGTHPLTTPSFGAATATTVNKVAITAPATGATLVIPDGVILTGPASSGTVATLARAETLTGPKTFVAPELGAALATSINGLTITTSTGTLTVPNGVVLTGPAASGTAATLAGTEALTNKSVNGLAITASTGTLTVPNGVVVIGPATSGTLVTLDGAETLTGKIFASPAISGSPSGIGAVQFIEVSITDAEMKALKAAPKTLVAAPGAGKFLQLLDGAVMFDYTAVYTTAVEDMAVKYQNGSGAIASQPVAAAGFIDTAGDSLSLIVPPTSIHASKAACENQALVFHNFGTLEYTGGNAANVVRVKLSYRTWNTGW